jgi:hypothetical protein
MVAVAVPAPVVLDQTVSTSAAKVAPVVLAVLVYRIQFVVPHNFSVVVAVEVERPLQIQTKQMALAGWVEVVWVDLVAEVLAPCQQPVRQTQDLVAVAVVGALQILNCNELVLQVQTELLYFRIQRQQQVFRVSLLPQMQVQIAHTH